MSKVRLQLQINDATHMGRVLLGAHKEHADDLPKGEYLIEIAYKGLLLELGQKKVFELEKKFIKDKLNKDDKTSDPNDSIGPSKEIEPIIENELKSNRKIENFVSPMG